MAIFQRDLRRKNYGALWNNLFNFFRIVEFSIANQLIFFIFSQFVV